MDSHQINPVAQRTMIVIWKWNRKTFGQEASHPLDATADRLYDRKEVDSRAQDQLIRADIVADENNHFAMNLEDGLPTLLAQLRGGQCLVLLHEPDLEKKAIDYADLRTRASSFSIPIRIEKFGWGKGPMYFKHSKYGLLGETGFAVELAPEGAFDADPIKSDLLIARSDGSSVINPRHFDRIWHLYWHKIHHHLTVLLEALQTTVSTRTPVDYPVTFADFLQEQQGLETLTDLQALSCADATQRCGFAGYEEHLAQFGFNDPPAKQPAKNPAEQLGDLRKYAANNLNQPVVDQQAFEKLASGLIKALADLRTLLPSEEKIL